MDIEGFIHALLEKEPGAPHSVELEMDVNGDPVALFEALLTAFITILKKWYRPPIDLGVIAEADIRKCAAYFASFGIQLNITIEDLPRVLRINNKEYETKSRLQDMIFRMSSTAKLYSLNFSYL